MRRPVIDATKIRKATRHINTNEPVSVKQEDIVESVTGFTSKTTDTPGFTLYTEYIAPGCVGAKFCHPKKVRVIRVISGSGRLFITDEEDITTVEKLTVGDVYVCDPGIGYQLSSFGVDHVELLIVEDAKYAARVQILAEAISTTDIKLPSFGGSGENVFEVTPQDKKKFSEKSAKAQAAKAVRTSKGGIFGESALPPTFVEEGLNAMPTMGNF